MKPRSLHQTKPTVRWEECVQCLRQWPFPLGATVPTDGFVCEPCLNADYARALRAVKERE